MEIAPVDQPAAATLASPSAGYPAGVLGDIFKTMDSTKTSLEKIKRVSINQSLLDVRNNIDRLTVEELAAIKKVADAKENQNLWSHGHIISSSLYASACIIFGGYLLSTGKEEGRSFVISGAVLLVNTLMSYNDGWKSIARLVSCGNATAENTLNTMLPIATTLMTMLLTASKLDDVPVEHKEKIKVLEKLMSWINLVIQLGIIRTSWMKGQAERQLINIEAQIKAEALKVEPINISNEAQTSIAKRINDNLKGAFKTIFKGTAAIPAV